MNGFLNPEEVLNRLDLKANMVAAEFGCGSGGFAIPLAKRLDAGLVYGLDIQQTPLVALKSRALLERVVNIRVIRCDLEKSRGSTLADSSIDLVLIANVLFQLKDKSAIISEAKRVLKNRGMLIVIDWLPQAAQGPVEGRVSSEEVKKIAGEIGFNLKREFRAGIYHYGLILKKL